MKAEVETRMARNPETGLPGVLLQLPYGYVVLKPEDARRIAEMLTLTAEEVEAL